MKIIIERKGEFEIEVYETDTIEDIKNRIIEEVNSEYPEYVLFDDEKEWKIPLPKEIKVWDLEVIYGKEKGKDILRDIEYLYEEYREIKKIIELRVYLEKYCFWLWKKIYQKKWMVYSMTVSSILTKQFIKRFGDKVDWNMSQFIQRRLLNEEYLRVMEETMKEERIELKRVNKKTKEMGEMWKEISIEGFEETEIEEIGKIMTVNIETEEYCTAMIFKNIRLTKEYPLAHYQEYISYHYPEGVNIIKEINRTELKKEGIYIFDRNGEVNIYIENRERGILIQYVSLEEREMSIEKIYNIIGIEKEKIKIEREFIEGVIAEWSIKTPKISMIKDKWLGIEPYIFANLCLNELPFSKFIWINDTDKISRTSWTMTRRNEGIYMYYFLPDILKGEEKKEEGIIYMDKWNRSKSRFGELSCIMTPMEREDGENILNIRITRSITRETVYEFRKTFLKLLRIYYKEYDYQWNQVFKKWLPNIRPSEMMRIEKNERVSRLPTRLDPEIFVPHVYLRSCQNPKVIMITEEEAKEIREKEKVLKFPPEKMDGYEPKYYKCPEEVSKRDGKQYLYPGLVKMNTKNHPFGYAPCCYIESHREQNEKIMKEMKREEEDDKNIKTMPLSFQYILKSEKILRRLGGVGILPNDLEEIFYNINIENEYYRVGGISLWSKFSILGGLEYWYAISNNRGYLRNSKELKKEIIENVSSIKETCSMEVFDWTLEKTIEEFINGYMDPRKYISILEEFYKVRIVIFKRNENGKIYILEPNYYQFLELKEFEETKPILCFYEHYGGTTESIGNKDEPICEIIVSVKDKKPKFDFIEKDVIKEIYKQCIRCYSGGTIKSLFKKNKGKEISRQYVDIGGKTIFIEYKNGLIGIMMEPIRPYEGVPRIYKIPRQEEVISGSIRNFESISKGEIEVIYIESLPIMIVKEENEYYLFSLKKGQERIELVIKNASIKTRKVSFESCPLYIRLIIYSGIPTREILYTKLLNDNSHALMLQDHLTYRFSYYLEENKKELKMYESQIEEWINVFLETCVEFTLDSEEYMNTRLYPMFIKDIDRKRKIRVPKESKKNIYYFLEWILKNTYNIEYFYKIREVPSYLNNIEQFPKIEEQIVQRCDEAYIYPSIYKNEIIMGPIETLKLDMDKIYYYRNESLKWEFFHNPCIVYRCETFQKGIERYKEYERIKEEKIYYYDMKREELFLIEENKIKKVENEIPKIFVYNEVKNDFIFFISI